jgi:PIN domain nuclease of toxin-antitoxin system
MRILIDTHILIWFLEGNSELSASHKSLIVGSDNEVFVSIASLWEMAIKVSTGKLTLANPLIDVISGIGKENIDILSITPAHTLQVSTLPFHHRDPFDRILIAQAQVEFLDVISDDSVFSDHEIDLI